MALLVALFAIASLVWLIPLVRSGRLIAIAMGVLALGTVLGPAFFAIDGPIQISMDRLLWLMMVVIAIAGWRLGFTHLPKMTRVDWVLLAIVGWCAVSAMRGGPVPTGSSPIAKWLFYLAMPAGMYIVARVVKLREQDLRWLFIGAVGLGLYLAITAVLEVTGVHGAVFPRYITDPEKWVFYGRGRGPLMNPAGNGFLLSIAVLASLMGFIQSGRQGKIFFALATLVLLVGAYATLTRSVWLGVAAALGLIGLVFTPRALRLLSLATVILIGGASMAGMKDEFVRLKRDKNLSAADAEKSIKLRPLLAVVAWEMFKDHPVMGHGYGHYFEHNERYHSNRSYGMPLEQARSYAQHNVFLSLLVDTGLVGLTMFMVWLISLFGLGWRMARQMPAMPGQRWIGLWMIGVITAYVCNGMFHDVMVIPMVHMFLFFLAGITVTLAQRGVETAVVRRAPQTARPTELAVPLIDG